MSRSLPSSPPVPGPPLPRSLIERSSEGQDSMQSTADAVRSPPTGRPGADGASGYVNPYGDLPSWWAFFWAGGWSWRWFGRPKLYFRAGLEYAEQAPFSVVDGLGRNKTFTQPFECHVDPVTGKLETLYVQAPASICSLGRTQPNGTWKRTPVRTVAPMALRIANLPFMFVPRDRRQYRDRYTSEDWATVVAMWIPTVAVFVLSFFFIGDTGPPPGKAPDKYLPTMYEGLRYPRLARNLLENRQPVALQLQSSPAWNSEGLGNYRTFRPRFLNYLVRRERNGAPSFAYERRPVPADDVTPYIVVAWASSHFAISDGGTDGGGDLEVLLGVATKAAAHYFGLTPSDNHSLEAAPRAFWVSANCIPPNLWVDEAGNAHPIDANSAESDELANQDTYAISDILRGAQHVVIAAGNPRRAWDDNALREWGERVWTLPEVVLSRGDAVTVWHCGRQATGLRCETRTIPKTVFPTHAWPDPLVARQLVEHHAALSLRLSRLELVKTALQCLMSRRFRELHPGDRVYVLMGLLRIRPPIDKTDSSFQAFARLSLPQDSDRLMERLICLLPPSPAQSWERIEDQYRASLWDIYPDTQVCAIGENDTVVIDGAKGAQIQWSGFTKVRTLRRMTLKRWLFIKTLVWSPLVLIIGAVIAALTAPPPLPQGFSGSTSSVVVLYNPVYGAGIAIVVLSLVLLVLPAPYLLWQVFGGKLWEVEPCLFGIEGYVPLEVIEEKLFGTFTSRMHWSAAGSPLSRHCQGRVMQERTVRYYRAGEDGGDEESAPLVPPSPQVSSIHTYPIETIDPCSPCDACSSASRYCRFHPTAASCHDMSRSAMGQMKVYTLVDTLSMTATLFYAVRPPTTLVVGGTEGGMKRAIACSFDMTTGTLYRETVLRIPSQAVDRMESLPRLRLGLRRPFIDGDVRRTMSSSSSSSSSSPPPGLKRAQPTSSEERLNDIQMEALRR